MGDNNIAESNVRRSRRIAAKTEDKPQLIDMMLEDLERDSLPRKKTDLGSSKRKIYRSANRKSRTDETGTLFDNGLQAVNILGATSIDDEEKGTNDLCYLVKYENGQFELVLNKVAHKFCPTVCFI